METATAHSLNASDRIELRVLQPTESAMLEESRENANEDARDHGLQRSFCGRRDAHSVDEENNREATATVTSRYSQCGRPRATLFLSENLDYD